MYYNNLLKSDKNKIKITKIKTLLLPRIFKLLVLSTCSCSRAVAGCRSFFEPILVHGESKKGATIPLPVTLPNRSTYGKVTGKNMVALFMAALWNRAGHYIFVLWVSSIFYLFSSPILSRSRLDVYHTYTYGVVLVRI